MSCVTGTILKRASTQDLARSHQYSGLLAAKTCRDGIDIKKAPGVSPGQHQRFITSNSHGVVQDVLKNVVQKKS